MGRRGPPRARHVRARRGQGGSGAPGLPPGRAQAVGADPLRGKRAGAMSKGVRAKDLRGNDPTELKSTVRKLEEDLFKHKLKKVTNQLENTMLIRNTRRDIA